jgi:hypothetical protein
MDAITPQVLDYYETMLRIAETQGIEIEVKPDEMGDRPLRRRGRGFA